MGDGSIAAYLPNGASGVCSVDVCERDAYAKGLCRTHYGRQRRTGSAGGAIVRQPGVRNWSTNAGGYVYRKAETGRGVEYQHRVVMEEHLGRPLMEHENVHHINGDRADNRLENLELWSTMQPAGQRVEDKVAFALEILALYAPERLADMEE